MDRRKFIQRSGAGFVGIAALKGPRLFGRPDSLNYEPSVAPHLLKLHLRQSGVPEEQFGRFEALAYLASDVLYNPSAARAFTRDPAGYLSDAGYSDVKVDTQSPEFRVALALADPSVREAATSNDPLKFVDALKRVGIETEDGGSINLVCIDVVVIVNVVALVLVLVGVGVGAVVVVVAAVLAIVLVAGPEPAETQTASLAAALGGKAFAEDVVKITVRRRVDAIVRAIEDGRIALRPDASKEQVIAQIQAAVARHLA